MKRKIFLLLVASTIALHCVPALAEEAQSIVPSTETAAQIAQTGESDNLFTEEIIEEMSEAGEISAGNGGDSLAEAEVIIEEQAELDVFFAEPQADENDIAVEVAEDAKTAEMAGEEHVWVKYSSGDGETIDVSVLTSLDLSGRTDIVQLSYSGCTNLVSLDISGCTALESLYCSDNSLVTLDVSGCTALTYLWCDMNSLVMLDVSGCTALTYLNCWRNKLTFLDLSGNTALSYLNCADNNLTTLDLSACVELNSLNSWQTLDIDAQSIKRTVDGKYEYDLADLIGKNNISKVKWLYYYSESGDGAYEAALSTDGIRNKFLPIIIF